jgi:hypothetical protein
MLRALNRNVERTFNTDRIDSHWGSPERLMSNVWIYEKGDILTVFETEPEARLAGIE